MEIASVFVNDDIFEILGQASEELVGDEVVRDRWKGCGLQGVHVCPKVFVDVVDDGHVVFHVLF